jgi:hypothetical protein
VTVVDTDILRVVASMLWTDGNVNQNVFNCRVSGGAGPYDDQDVADDMEDWLDNLYLNLTAFCSDQLDGNEVIIYKFDTSEGDWDEVSSQGWTWDPAVASDQLPRGVAGLVRMWTTNADVQGKKYLAGLVESNATDGLFIAAALVAFLAFAADWYTPFVGSATGATFTPGIWSVAKTLFFAGVDHIAASAIPAYQRRRKRNVGI